jgi:2-polyprenyl-6-methoxyphenol hydroxylase-like FAD-dependent oxidoreductase
MVLSVWHSGRAAPALRSDTPHFEPTAHHNQSETRFRPMDPSSFPRFEVAIVGGGPVGLVLAIELGRRGVRTVLFNDRRATSPYAQANATQARTMEHFRRLGLAERVRALGLPSDYPTDITYFTRYAGWELARFSLPSSRDARVLVRSLGGSWSAAELAHRCSQMYVERVLFEEASRLPSVELRFGWRVERFSEEQGGIGLGAVREPDGSDSGGQAPEATVHARWVVGCDGARGAVRRHLGIDYAGETGVMRDFMGGRMHAMHFRSPDLYRIIDRPPAWMYWAFNGERRGFMPAINGVDEFVFHSQLQAGEEAGDVDDARARAMFFQALGRECRIEILSRSSWTAGHALVAQRMRAGRFFLAGDAAHLFTPTGGLGYNTGVDDAVNLGWKLAMVSRRIADEALLDSYEVERRPVALRNTAFARGFADSIGLYRPPDGLEAPGPRGDTIRAEAGQYLERHARAEFNIPGITFGARYDGSPIIGDDDEAPPADRANAYEPTSVPGGRAPHLWLDERNSLFDRFGFEFTLLAIGATARASELQRAFDAAGMPVRVLALDSQALRELYRSRYVLVRPDQVVAWRGDSLPAEPASLLDRACCRPVR